MPIARRESKEKKALTTSPFASSGIELEAVTEEDNRTPSGQRVRMRLAGAAVGHSEIGHSVPNGSYESFPPTRKLAKNDGKKNGVAARVDNDRQRRGLATPWARGRTVDITSHTNSRSSDRQRRGLIGNAVGSQRRGLVGARALFFHQVEEFRLALLSTVIPLWMGTTGAALARKNRAIGGLTKFSQVTIKSQLSQGPVRKGQFVCDVTPKMVLRIERNRTVCAPRNFSSARVWRAKDSERPKGVDSDGDIAAPLCHGSQHMPQPHCKDEARSDENIGIFVRPGTKEAEEPSPTPSLRTIMPSGGHAHGGSEGKQKIRTLAGEGAGEGTEGSDKEGGVRKASRTCKGDAPVGQDQAPTGWTNEGDLDGRSARKDSMDSGGTNHRVIQCSPRGVHSPAIVVGANEGDEGASARTRRTGVLKRSSARAEEDEHVIHTSPGYPKTRKADFALLGVEIRKTSNARAEIQSRRRTLAHGRGKALAMDPRLTRFQHDECLKHDRRGRVHKRTYGKAARLTEALAVGSARASKEVPICRSRIVGRERDGNMGRRRRDGGIRPPRRPKSDADRGGDERMKRRRGASTGFVSMTPSKGESNPATQHAGGGGADRKESEGGYEALRTILIRMRRMRAGKE
ncbi:hypothetical protein B0H14DRAFT_3127437 [Mycena olivaceomarginata]|nr:hypothetical protein B0H14DRAFT_3127437 [Mycena olivaceomarginata]